MTMTLLGQMLMEDGIEKGIEKGKMTKLINVMAAHTQPGERDRA